MIQDSVAASGTSILAMFSNPDFLGAAPPDPILFVSLRTNADETAFVSWLEQEIDELDNAFQTQRRNDWLMLIPSDSPIPSASSVMR